MKSAKEIIEECKKSYKPNNGVKALAEAANDDPTGFCIMDNNDCYTSSYREECPDRCSCYKDEYMLACVVTREYSGKVLIGEKAIKIYNVAMQDTRSNKEQD